MRKSLPSGLQDAPGIKTRRTITSRRVVLAVGSTAMLVAAFTFVGLGEAISEIRRFEISTMVGVATFFAINLCLVSLRLHRLLQHFGICVPLRVSLRANVAGQLAAMFFISLFGQALGRGIVLGRHGVAPTLAASLTAYEKLVIAAVGGAVAVVGAATMAAGPLLQELAERVPIIEIATASLLGLVLGTAVARSRFEARLLSQLFSRANLSRVLEVSGMTLLGQALVIGSLVAAVKALHPSLDTVNLFAAAALVSFAASIPLTINGWGLREVAAVYAFGLVGVPAASALAPRC